MRLALWFALIVVLSSPLAGMVAGHIAVRSQHKPVKNS
jgi:hypothetical protein